MGVDIVVGTPGRIIDHIERGTLDLSELDIVVLDEVSKLFFFFLKIWNSVERMFCSVPFLSLTPFFQFF